MSLKDLIFQKGGIGQSLSRQDTIDRLNPLIKQHMELNHAHNAVIGALSDADLAAALSAEQRIARMDVGKMMETVFSAGGVAYNGVELEPASYHLGDTDDDMLFELLDRETALRDAVDAEFKLDGLEHQIRTKAILNNVLTHSQQRLDLLKTATKRRRRPV